MNFDDMMKQMRVKYLADLKTKTEELKTLLENKDTKGLEDFFHKLKGSGASYGLPQISEYGAKYERKAKENSLTDEDLEKCELEYIEVLKAA